METLLADAEAWRRADDLRAYIAAVEERAADSDQPTDANPKLAEWLLWASEQADRLDPVPRILCQLRGVNVAAKGDVCTG